MAETTTAAPAATGAAAPAPEVAPAEADPAAGGTVGAQAGQAGTSGKPAGESSGVKKEFTPEEIAFLTALQDERGKRQQLESELAELRRTAPAPATPAPAGQTNLPADPLSTIGDDDLITGANIKSILFPLVNQLAGAIAMVQRGQQHPDMGEAITTFLPQVIKSDPAIGQALNQVQGPARMILAHALGSLAKRAATGGSGTPPQQPNNGTGAGTPDLASLAAQILANAAKPAPAGAGGGSPININAEQLRRMSDAEFTAYQNDLKKMWARNGIGT
jgi:hypothetical protein